MKDNIFNIGDKVRVKNTLFTGRVAKYFEQQNTKYWLKVRGKDELMEFYEDELTDTFTRQAIQTINRCYKVANIARYKLEKRINSITETQAKQFIQVCTLIALVTLFLLWKN